METDDASAIDTTALDGRREYSHGESMRAYHQMSRAEVMDTIVRDIENTAMWIANLPLGFPPPFMVKAKMERIEGLNERMSTAIAAMQDGRK